MRPIVSRIFLTNSACDGRAGRAAIMVMLALVGPSVFGQEIDGDRLKTHVATLASKEYGGRRGEGADKAREYVRASFVASRLRPAFGDSYEQAIPGVGPGEVLGRNVAAILDGAGDGIKDEFILVAAHFDHLGVRGEVLYPGADDNASGVAMLLEVARCLAAEPPARRRSVLFVGFDLEERALWGSRYMVEHMPVPLDKVKLMLTADMIGRSLGGIASPYVFAMGTENAQMTRPWLERGADGLPIKVGRLGSDLLLLDRSDYGPFRSRKVPYLFFSTGENPRYHQPTDTPETLDYPKLTAISRLIHRVVKQSIVVEPAPTWAPAPAPDIAEAATLRDVIRLLLENREALAIKGPIVVLMRGTLANLDAIVARGAMTTAERSRVVRAAQAILLAVF